MEEAPVLEPLEHSVLKKPLDGGSLEGISVVDWFVQLVMETLEHSILAPTSVWEPLEHSNCVVTDHVDIDSLWMAPWDAGRTLGDSCRPSVVTWRTVFRSVVRLFRRPGLFAVVWEPRTDVCTGCVCGTDGSPHGEPGR